MGFPYQARQRSTWTWLAVSLVSEVSLDCGWAPLPRCQLKRPSVRLIRAGGGPARLLIKVMSCKIEREGGDSRLLPATLSFIMSAQRWTFPLYLFSPVTVNGFVYVDKPETAVRWRLWGCAALVSLSSYYRSIILSGLMGCDYTVCFGLNHFCFHWSIRGIVNVHRLKKTSLCVNVKFNGVKFVPASPLSNSICEHFVSRALVTDMCVHASRLPFKKINMGGL